MMDILLQPDWLPRGINSGLGGSRDTSETMQCHESGSCDGISEGRHAVCAAGICGYARPGTILTNPG